MTSRTSLAYLTRTLTMCAAVAGLCAAAIPAAGAASHPARATAVRPAVRPVPSWHLVAVPVQSHFRGLAVVSRNVIWLGGYNGVVLRTVNGGRTWNNVSPPGASALQFRDISAFSATRAVAMAAGPGTGSRLYATTNGGRSWSLAYRNTSPSAFFDCMAFFDSWHGLVLSDPVNGKFRILSTRDGGRSWTVLPSAGMPPALPGEAGFAASGECLTTWGHDAWFGSGGGSAARVFHSRDGGLHWRVSDVPMVSNLSSGVFGLAFRTPRSGVAVGGNFSVPSASARVAALSYFGSWFSPPSGPAGYRSGVTWVPRTLATVIAVGLTGSDVSYDGGLHWRTFALGQFDTVSCAADGSCWASGDLGRVAFLKQQ